MILLNHGLVSLNYTLVFINHGLISINQSLVLKKDMGFSKKTYGCWEACNRVLGSLPMGVWKKTGGYWEKNMRWYVMVVSVIVYF